MNRKTWWRSAGLSGHRGKSLVKGAGPVLRIEIRQQIAQGRKGGQAGAPARLSVARPELEPDPEWHVLVLASVQHGQYRFGEDQWDISLQSFTQALAPMRSLVDGRRHVHVDVFVAHLDGENPHVVGPKIERSAAAEIETRVVPV